ncbi:MAG: 23S rRNA (pseudouridine(1915)-N(3))-methyltransferase RlmH [Candidatus Adiutrix sp.]
MKHNFLFPGKTKEIFLANGIQFYLKRLKPLAEVREIILKGGRGPMGETPSTLAAAKAKEAANISALCSSRDYLLVLDVAGQTMSSPKLAQHLEQLETKGVRTINWVVGGPWGLDDTLLKKADLRLSFGPMTFPHDLARVMLLEQVYRAFSILAKTPYHK